MESRSDNYWYRRMGARGVTRRRFIGGAAATGAGAAALGLVGCGDDDDAPGTTPTAAGTTAAGSPTAAASPTAAVAQPTKGGTARFTSANNTWDVFDIDRSIFSTTAAYIHGLSNLGVVQYDSFKEAKLGPGFAGKWEQPDAKTVRFTLRDNLFWQNKPPVNGRAATANDIVQFVLRNRDNKLRDGTVDKSTFYRGADYSQIESATAPDDKTVVVKFSSPNIFFLDTLSTSYAKVQAPEAIDKFEKEYNKLQAEQIIGTGAFELTDFKAEGTLTQKRFDKFPVPAFLDAIKFLPLFDQAAWQAAFEQKQLDEFVPAKKAVLDDVLKRFDKQVTNLITFTANPGLVLTNGGGPPWNNDQLLLAISRVIDRRGLISAFFGGLGGIFGQVPPSQAAFSIPEKELITLPGYLEDHAKDIAEGKKLWEAQGGPALGKITLDIPDVLELAIPGFSAGWQKEFKQLGNDIEVKIVPFSTIISKINALQYGRTDLPTGSVNIYIGVFSDTAGPEPTASFYRNYNSSQPRAKVYGPTNPEADALTEKAFNELDVEKRKDLMKQFQRVAIAHGGMGLMCSYIQYNNNIHWNYLKIPERATFITSHQANRLWIDTKDATYSGRPT
jgi:ABC-type transport system substrate-binding protein